MVDQFGTSLPTEPDKRAEAATRAADLVAHLRLQGRANLSSLKRIRDRLAIGGTQRRLIRVFDAVLWLSHPGAVLAGAKRSITVDLR